MSLYLKNSVGIDISKKSMDVCISVIDNQQEVIIKGSRVFDNTKSGIRNLIEWINKRREPNLSLTFTMEATGVYYERLVLKLYELGYSVCVVLPNKAKKYKESIGYKSKNDKIDARGLSKMGAEQKLKAWIPFSKNIYKLRTLTRHYENLQKQRTILLNRKESQQYSRESNSIVLNQISQMLDLINEQIDSIKEAIKQAINQDLKLKEKVEKIEIIKGLGIITIAAVIAETNGFYLFKNQRQLVSYSGYDIIENQSGNRVGKTRISKKGNSHIRRAMHMPALNMVRYEQAGFKQLYERIYKKKNLKMKAYTAVQRKLLILIYTLWKNNEKYDPNYYKASGNDETESLFPLGFEKSDKNVAPVITEATQDELP